MFTINDFEYDCPKNCTNQKHGNAITAALTKTSIPDDKLAAFIAKTCRNFAKICDSSGRTALHAACSVGRYTIAEWLLNHGALINFQDVKSSCTPLEHSIRFGYIDCAVLLIRYGANADKVSSCYQNHLQTSIKGRYKWLDVADEEFKAFAIFRILNFRKYFAMPKLPAEEYTFKNLLDEASEFNVAPDITFHVDSEKFPAHKFIVFCRSNTLMDIVRHSGGEDVYLNFTGLTAKMFELILKFIYANYVISEQDLDDMLESMGPSAQSKRVDVLNIFKEFVHKFELHELFNCLERFNEELQFFRQKPKFSFSPLRRSMFPDLYDVVFKCANGTEIYAHKCVLGARSDYFNAMFNSCWAKTDTINLTTIPVEYMGPIVDFVYTLDANHFRKLNYPKSVLYKMIVLCDQFFINRLQRVCEALMLEELSTWNCGEMLEFACYFRCELLEKGCLDFICLNLKRILELHSLESCQPEVLARISNFYRDTCKGEKDFQGISLQSDCISDEGLIEFVSNFTVDLNYKMRRRKEKNLKITPKTKLTQPTESKRNYEKEAISWLRQISLDVDDLDTGSIAETKELCGRVHSGSDEWIKVEAKKREITNPLKSNHIRPESSVSPKRTPNKSTHIKRDYVKEAINWLREISFDPDQQKPIIGLAYKKEHSDKANSKPSKWIKVPNTLEIKKDAKSTPVKINQITQEEKNPKKDITKLPLKTTHPEPIDEDYEGATACPIVSLIDFVKTDKLSEKQRKLLLPERESTISNDDLSTVWQLPLHSFADIMKSSQSSKDSLETSSGVRSYDMPEEPSLCSSVLSNPDKLVVGSSRPQSLSFSEALQANRGKRSNSLTPKLNPYFTVKQADCFW